MADTIRKDGLVIRLGWTVAAITFALDQLSKWWILRVVNLDEREPIEVTSFFELAMAWNKGVSYSWFTTDMQWLLTLMMLAIVTILANWLRKATSRGYAAALGLIIGGALGNALDRMLHGAVADFVHLHWGSFSWYIFNVADIAIVAGAMVLAYFSFTTPETPTEGTGT
jgi:signal peptidase II